MDMPLEGVYALFEPRGGHRHRRSLGTFLGVFVPTTCTVFGVVVFLRLGFVVGQAGIWMTLSIVAGSFMLCLLTTLSLCALISDGDSSSGSDAIGPQYTKDPGIYSALRRAIGPEFGAMLGITFYLAFAVDVAWYLVGFSENLQDAIGTRPRTQVFPWNPRGTWVSTIISSLSLLVISGVCSRGVHLTARISLVVLIAIVACIIASLLCLLWPTYDPESGPTAPSLERFLNNSQPDLTPFNDYTQPTITLMFVLIFPGFTGVLAGSNLSGDLVEPTRSIARGTLFSLLFVVATYAAICLTLAATVERQVLKTNLRVMDTVVTHVLHVPLGQVGVGLTTLSSALSYMLGAPRVLQAVCRDAGWRALGTAGYEEGTRREPVRAFLLTWALVQLILLTGTINLLAPLVSGLFLLTFCFLNLLAFVASVSRQSFAPRFRCHSRWSSLGGFLLTFMAMAWALAATPEVAGALGILFVVLLLWKRHALMRLCRRGQFVFAGEGARGGHQLQHEASRRLSVVNAGDDARQMERFERAAFCVHNALRGTFLSRELILLSDLKRVNSQRTLVAARAIRHGAMVAYMALSFVERPVWCYGKPTCDIYVNSTTLNGTTLNGTTVSPPSFELWVLPLWASQAIEAACVLVFFWEMSHKLGYMSRQRFFSSAPHVVQLILLLLDLAGIVVSAISPGTLTFFNPIVRPLLFVAMGRRTRRAVFTFLRVLPDLANWAAMLVVLLLFYALLGVMLFGPPEPLLADDGDYFASLPAALLSLVVLITTANFPDVMLKAYSQSHTRSLTFVFFASFLLLGLFFVMNMFLAEVCTNYTRQLEAEAALARRERDEALRFAFELVDFNNNGYVSIEDFVKMIRRLQAPTSSLFDLHTTSEAVLDQQATDRALVALNRLLRAAETQGDQNLPTRGLGPEYFCRLVLALRQDSASSSSSSFHTSLMASNGHDPHPPLVPNAAVERAGAMAPSSGAGASGRGEDDGESSGVCSNGAATGTRTGSAQEWPAHGSADHINGDSGDGDANGDGLGGGPLRTAPALLDLVDQASVDVTRATAEAEEDGARARGLWSQPRDDHAPVKNGARWRSVGVAMRWLSVAAHGRAGEVLLSLVLLTDTALLCVEVDMSARQRGAQAVLRPCVPIFALVYFAELLYKLHALGIARYASAPAHAFDGLVTLVSVGADILAVGPLAAKPRATRVALALRTLRLLRLFTTLRRFRSIFRRVVRLLPQLAGLFGAIWALFSVFAELGVLLFGGTLYAGDAWWHDHQTAEAQRYIYCNFNDFGSAVVTLFELLIVNNWQEIMEEVVVVDGEWSRLFFLSWWLLAVLVMFNLLIALFLQEMSTPLHSEAVGDGLRGPTAAAYGTLATGAARAVVSVGAARAATAAHPSASHSQSLLAKATTTTTGAAGAGLAPLAPPVPTVAVPGGTDDPGGGPQG